MAYLDPPHLLGCGCNKCVDGQKRREMTDRLNAPRTCPQCARFRVSLRAVIAEREALAEKARISDFDANVAFPELQEMVDRLKRERDTALAQLAEKEKQLESISCGPRLDPSRCSGCNGTGRKDCICGGKGTVEAERDGYKVAALNQLLKPPVTCAGCGSKEHRTDGCPDNPTSKEEL